MSKRAESSLKSFAPKAEWYSSRALKDLEFGFLDSILFKVDSVAQFDRCLFELRAGSGLHRSRIQESGLEKYSKTI